MPSRSDIEVTVLGDLAPPRGSFASDNSAGAHPEVMAAVLAANGGHVPGYGQDELTIGVAGRFAELFGQPVEVALAFGGTGANVVALHAVTGPGGVVLCSAEAHILRHEADAPAHITGARLLALPTTDGKITGAAIDRAAAPLGPAPGGGHHVVSVSHATELGTAYRPDELAEVCAAAHRHGMVVHVDGARLANALVAWGYGPADLAAACRALAGCGVDVVVFGGTKAGLLGAEAIVFCEPALAHRVAERRKQVTQTASKMRFLAAQYEAALDRGRILAWAGAANAAAALLGKRLAAIAGVELAQPVETNAVFCRIPERAIEPLRAWTPCSVWDAAGGILRFVASWDTTDEDVDRLAAGVAVLTRSA